MTTSRRPKRRYVRLTGARLLLVALLAAPAVGSVSAESARNTQLIARSQKSTLRNLQRRVNRIEKMVERMEQIATRYRQWRTCLRRVPVSEYGDRDHRFGYRYDERDGTGLDHRPALARDTSDRRPDFMFLKFAHRDDCHSDPTKPGTPQIPGTADPAVYIVSSAAADRAGSRVTAAVARRSLSKRSVRSRVRTLERRLRNLEKRATRLDRMSEHFDEWESCLTWVPVTEYGDPDGRFGYLFEREGTGPGYMPALAIDISEWDDPDYMFLAFAGRDRPFTNRECRNEPGESVD